MIRSLLRFTSTTRSTNSLSTKLLTPFLALVLPEYYNLYPSISRALTSIHLVSWIHATFTLCICKALTNSIDLLLKVPIFQHTKHNLPNPSPFLPRFPPKDKFEVHHYWHLEKVNHSDNNGTNTKVPNNNTNTNDNTNINNTTNNNNNNNKKILLKIFEIRLIPIY